MPVATRVLEASRSLFEGESDFVVARGASGELGVLPSHAPLLTWLKPGELMVRRGQEERYFFLESAYLEVLPDRISVLAEGAVPSSQLDSKVAEEQRRLAEEAVARATGADDADLASLRRRLEVAEARHQAAERERRRRG
ncbi:MAG: ATP synthase F1 subunit epsilon [Candidatus Dormibacteria bacterium]